MGLKKPTGTCVSCQSIVPYDAAVFVSSNYSLGRHKPRAFCPDCYGTLLDWKGHRIEGRNADAPWTPERALRQARLSRRPQVGGLSG